MTQALHIVVLAAGQGKRMRSVRPKVLQPLAGRPMLAHVLETACSLEPALIHVVHGHGGAQVQAAFDQEPGLHWVLQAEQRGTGHAVQIALADVPAGARVLVLLGDAPLVEARTLVQLHRAAAGGLAILTARVADPTGYGRILRQGDGVTGIVEERDADPAQRAIDEVNSGFLAGSADDLRRYLDRVQDDNAQGEIYLTDVVGLAVAEGQPVAAVVAESANEILGANDRLQLAALERCYQARQVAALCRDGAIVMDAGRIDVRGSTQVGQDVVIDINVVLEGQNVLGDEVQIGPHCVLRDCRLGPRTRVHPHSVLEGVETEGDCDIGPFARLRAGTRLATGCKIGNFVETKKVDIGAGSKASHLSYLGDATIGQGVNIGAGTITCNYDGVNKHQTVIEDGAFIGSDSQLVAPVKVESGATIGAGSTITRTAPRDELTVSRVRQVTIKGWQKPTKKS